MLSNIEVGESLRWKKLPVLDQGFVTLVDWMGDDSSVVQAARVSYGAGTKHVSDDATLIRYLYRHAHTTPFEMCEIKLLLRIPMDAWRQYIRHRTASVNEYSTRYSEAIDANQTTAIDQWRLQDASNKQGSSNFVTKYPDDNASFNMSITPGDYLSGREHSFHIQARDIYEERLKFGVAREQARKDLPLSTYTEAYWKCDLKNLLGFLSLRMDSHAQLEIRSYADIIGNELIAKLFPICWSAFEDYDQRRDAMLLSALDVKVIRHIMKNSCDFWDAAEQANGWPKPPAKCRERDESLAKLRRLGLSS